MKIFYTKEHGCVKIDGEQGTIGISAYAAEQLGDITYVDLPEAGDEIAKGETFCSVESVKAASDIYGPVTGIVTAVNEELMEAPEVMNESPEDEGLILKVEITDTEEEGLLTPEEYDAYLETID